ncbi:tape measure protein [Thermaurantimonas aggregans]|uniref:tape measure protein n=1 Tax=Thermaurantimonas aggregans TaxID=2173829 RepID=UPI0023F01A84|nr:tape measure protein [Thermaurantimonas aggregans]MCX8149213.1 tape measure protein [Thermaurantimonas aggregans]
MNTLVEYTLYLHDKVSATLQKIAINNEQALEKFANLQKQSVQVSRTLANMGTSIGSLSQKLQLLKAERDWIPANDIQSLKAYNNEIARLEKHIQRLQTIKGNPLQRWAKEALSALPGANLLLNPIVAISTGVGIISRLGIEAEKTAKEFEVMLQSKDKADALLSSINAYADASTYKSSELAKLAAMMLSFNIPASQVVENLKIIGDIAMGDAGKMQQLTLAFSQMSSTGRLTGQDLLQMINAGFNPLQQLSKSTGLSIPQLKEAMEKGQISAQMVRQAFAEAVGPSGTYYKMNEQIAQTTSGKLSMLVKKSLNTLQSLYTVIEPLLVPLLETTTKLLDLLGKGISYVVEGFTRLRTALQQGNIPLITLISALGSYLLTIQAITLYKNIAIKATHLWTAAQAGLNTVLKMNPIALKIALLTALATAIYLAFQKIGWFRGAVYAAWEALKGFGQMLKILLFDNLKNILQGIGQVGEALLALFQGKFQVAAQKASAAFNNLTGINTANQLIESFSTTKQKALYAYEQGVKEIEEKQKKKTTRTDVKKPKNLYDLVTSAAQNTMMPEEIPALKGGLTSLNTSSHSPTTQTKQITINVQKFIDQVVFNHYEQSEDELRAKLERIMLQILISAQNA